MPRATRTVARFSVGPPRLNAIKKIRLRKRVLTWQAQPGVKTYEIAITYPNRTTTSHTAKRARFTLPATVARKGTIRIAIVALDATGRSGPLTKSTLKLPAP